MVQEEAISQWMEMLDEKKKIIADREQRNSALEEENGALMTKNVKYKE